MEKKQLNFSAPLISARRYSSPLRSSGEDMRRDNPNEHRNPIISQQTDLHLGEVAKPGSIPFMWEQEPGKAKDGIESRVTSPEENPSTPKFPLYMPFPPGKKSGELTGYRTPNKLSGELNVLRPQNRFSGEINTLKSNRLSGELNTFRQHNKFSGELSSLCKYSTSNYGMVKWDSSKDGTEMNASSGSENEGDCSFSDAIEGLSNGGSFSVNCSVSGLSGSQQPELDPSEFVSSDPRARDFMINRFLPAAKAMTIEPSQYVSRKQTVVGIEQTKEVKALVPRAMTPPPSRNVCHIVPYTGQDIGSEESDEDEGSFDDRSNISIKVKSCGFLPWFCSKNALRLINPLPAMKHKSKSALSSASKVSNLIKTKSWRSPSPKRPTDLHNYPNYRVAPSFKSCELQKPKLSSRPMFYSGELETRSGSPYRGSRRSNVSVSPCRNESSHSLYQKGVGFVPVPKSVDSYDDYKSKVANKGSKRHEDPRKNTRSSGTRPPVSEKTLYIDPANIPKVSHSIMNVSNNKRQVHASTKSGPLPQGLRSGSSLQYGGRVEIMKARGVSGPLVCGGAQAGKPYSESYFTRPSKIPGHGNTNTCRELVVVEDDNAVSSSLTPPLPKSPSESWLSRQLPSVSPRVSPRNSVSYANMNSKILSRKQNPKIPPSGAKWETIVKSSHLRQDHGRYSEELVTHVHQLPQIWK
ncbi:hypothetical protein RND81_06G101800 [Saponaria officinalis]|uniref:Uncharacterized protein n=1 Tax=Saponaria officinalis TaxID=3572 RepID=A0AAW1K4R0_SAPOF